ncbi:hypothetical protein K501DRAFT_275270 [Backusella circina FSU 941]|nr:hypothetical protein K501DRAFT_275270 [Backusella circina FSU 941]
MHILPKLKTFRLICELKRESPVAATRSTPLKKDATKKSKGVAETSTDNANVKVTQTEIEALKRQLEELKKERQDDFMKKVKLARWSLNKRLMDVKEKFSFRKTTLFNSEQQTEIDWCIDPPESQAANKKVKISGLSFKCLEKVEDMEVNNKLVKSGKLTFSGTNNGIVTMTETVALSLDRFKYPIKLYNRYAALDEPSTSRATEPPMDELDSVHLSLPKSFKANVPEIQLKNGPTKRKKKLELLKKSAEYKEVVDKENHPDHSDFYSTNNSAKIQDAFEKCKEIRKKKVERYISQKDE